MKELPKLIDSFEDGLRKVQETSFKCRQIIDDNDLQIVLDSVLDGIEPVKDEMLRHYLEVSLWRSFAESLKLRAKDLLGSDS